MTARPALVSVGDTSPVSARVVWRDVLARAAPIVESYDTSVTLRQLFYRLVAGQWLPNTTSRYKKLSEHTADARRAGTFPALTDRGRSIHRLRTFTSPADARRWLKRIYRRDRTEGQPFNLYLAIEKAGLVEQLMTWFTEPYGIPVVPLGGYSSEPIERDVKREVAADGRPAVLLIGTDFDASGEDIQRNFVKYTDCWSAVRRIALTPEQVVQYALPINPGNPDDTRAKKFEARHGELVQVELDALLPEDLRALFAAAIAEFWDEAAYQAVLAQEAADRRRL